MGVRVTVAGTLVNVNRAADPRHPREDQVISLTGELSAKRVAYLEARARARYSLPDNFEFSPTSPIIRRDGQWVRRDGRPATRFETRGAKRAWYRIFLEQNVGGTRNQLIRKRSTAETAFIGIIGASGLGAAKPRVTYNSGGHYRFSSRTKWHGQRVRTQYRIAGFYPDFVFLRKRLAIEIDGKHHRQPEQIEKDRARDQILKAAGWRVLRIPAFYVYNDPKWVEMIVAKALTTAANTKEAVATA